MRRILLGISTKCHDKLEQLKEVREFVKLMKKQTTINKNKPKDQKSNHDIYQSPISSDDSSDLSSPKGS